MNSFSLEGEGRDEEKKNPHPDPLPEGEGKIFEVWQRPRIFKSKINIVMIVLKRSMLV